MIYTKDIETFVKNKAVFCGIDVHKHHWNLCFISDGMVIEKTKMTSDFQKLLTHLDRFYNRTRALHFVYEAGFSGFHFCRQLRASGYQCIITPPNRVPSYNDKVKTDKRDAVKLAQYLSSGLLKEVFVPPVTAESDRQVLRLRHDYQKKLTRVKNQIKSHLHLYGINKPDWVGSYWTNRHIAWLTALEFKVLGLPISIKQLS